MEKKKKSSGKSFEEAMEDLGKKLEETFEKKGDEIGKKIEKKITKKVEGPARRFGYLLTILINIFILWTAHNVLNWDHEFFDFVQEDFKDVLWAIDLSVGITIFVNALWLVYDGKVFKGILKLIENSFSILLMVVLIVVFPYDFRELIDISWINTFVRFLFVIGIIGTIVGSVVETAKTLWEVMKEGSKLVEE